MTAQARVAVARSLIRSARAWRAAGHYENAALCLERARRSLRADPGYDAGSKSVPK